MIHKGFKMKLYDGMAEEYEKRHNELWPEMKDMIHEHGGKNYSILLDKETMVLYGYIELWKQILITVLFQKIYTLYSIWIDKMCIN